MEGWRAHRSARTEETKMKKAVVALFVIAVAMAVPGFATPITISNPGFDDDPQGKGTSEIYWPIGYTHIVTCTDDCIADWELTSGNVDWVSDAVWQAHNGNWSIDLNGNTNGTLSLSIPGLAAGTYDLNFWMSKNYMKTGQAELALKWTGQDTPATYAFSGANTAENMMWTEKSATFVWGGGDFQITFQSLQTLQDEISLGPAIDDITLNRRDEGVPEPGTLWTLLTGAGLLGLAVRLRRR